MVSVRRVRDNCKGQ